SELRNRGHRLALKPARESASVRGEFAAPATLTLADSRAGLADARNQMPTVTHDSVHHLPAEAKPRQMPEHFWLWVMCLLGVDYFSTLAYQPSITFEATGRLGPLATVVVVLITLFGALPVYWYVAGRSSRGQGSIALLERVVHGWRG